MTLYCMLPSELQ